MFTHSGIYIDGDVGIPTIKDVAVGLGRLARFAGALKVWYPVLSHSFAVADILAGQGYGDLYVYGLLHDAHEILTGDVPTPAKCECIRDMQDRFDSRFYPAVGLEVPDDEMAGIVKRADNVAFYCEAFLFGPPGLWDRVRHDKKNCRGEEVKAVTVPDSKFLDIVRYRAPVDDFSAFTTIDPEGGLVRSFVYEVEAELSRSIFN